MDVATFRRELLDLVGEAVPLVGDHDREPDVPRAGVPIACLVVVEWQGDDGARWLSRLCALSSGDEAPRWTAEMLAREALHWTDNTPKDDD